MTEILNFAGEHVFLAWSALWLLWGLFIIPQFLLSMTIRTYRMVMVIFRGWPPCHLDADGDWKPLPKQKDA